MCHHPSQLQKSLVSIGQVPFLTLGQYTMLQACQPSYAHDVTGTTWHHIQTCKPDVIL